MNAKKNKGFSLVELVIVVVIIGILAAIAIPRLSRGASGAADSSLHGNLKVLRTAIDLYASEHGGTYPLATTAVAQLTQFSDDSGATSTTASTTKVYGPYLRTVPTLSVGTYAKGANGISGTGGSSTTVGWVYTEGTGVIVPNVAPTDADAKGVLYSTY